jgi:hypothetical protein
MDPEGSIPFHKNTPLVSPERAQASSDIQKTSYIPDSTKEIGDFNSKNK